MEETFKPFSGAQILWAIFSDVLIDLKHEQNRTQPEEWTTTDWDEVGQDLLGQINNALDLAMPSEINYYDPNYDYASLPSKQRKEIDAAIKRTKIIIAEQKQEAAQAWAEFRTNAEQIPTAIKPEYWDGILQYSDVASKQAVAQVNYADAQKAIIRGVSPDKVEIINEYQRQAGLLETSSHSLFLAFKKPWTRGLYGKDDSISNYPVYSKRDGNIQFLAEISPIETPGSSEQFREELHRLMFNISTSLKINGVLVNDVIKVLFARWKEKKDATGNATVLLNEICEDLGVTKSIVKRAYPTKKRNEIRQIVEYLQFFRFRVNKTNFEPFKKSKKTLKPTLEMMSDYLIRMAKHRINGQGDDEQADFFAPTWNAITFAPGAMFAKMLIGERNQNPTMVVPESLIRLEHRKYRAVKLLGEALCESFRVNAKNGVREHRHRISTLLDWAEFPEEATSEDRVKRALDTLIKENIIATYAFETSLEKIKANRGGIRVSEMDTKTWLDSKVIICQISEITEQYAHIAIAHKKRLPALAQPGDPISEQFKRTRADRGLTYEKAAEQIGVSVGTLSNIENGSNPRAKTAEKIRQWMAA